MPACRYELRIRIDGCEVVLGGGCRGFVGLVWFEVGPDLFDATNFGTAPAWIEWPIDSGFVARRWRLDPGDRMTVGPRGVPCRDRIGP